MLASDVQITPREHISAHLGGSMCWREINNPLHCEMKLVLFPQFAPPSKSPANPPALIKNRFSSFLSPPFSFPVKTIRKVAVGRNTIIGKRIPEFFSFLFNLKLPRWFPSFCPDCDVGETLRDRINVSNESTIKRLYSDTPKNVLLKESNDRYDIQRFILGWFLRQIHIPVFSFDQFSKHSENSSE
ncbi:hypothetical protein TNCV_2628581 [Trichonephila clavipes]|uniref:Uncharacterized protein n=1 Tax=Trichonephila clavipes TaxID=2585209 RepID=A0A8X6VK39_TRICX|nr:hypothetical protein TNCV_2628581 [Trichonephila clavipes]